MRDPQRIDRILGLIGVLWKKQPDMRFNQLIENIRFYCDSDKELVAFYWEDEQFEEALNTCIGTIEVEDE